MEMPSVCPKHSMETLSRWWWINKAVTFATVPTVRSATHQSCVHVVDIEAVYGLKKECK